MSHRFCEQPCARWSLESVVDRRTAGEAGGARAVRRLAATPHPSCAGCRGPLRSPSRLRRPAGRQRSVLSGSRGIATEDLAAGIPRAGPEQRQPRRYPDRHDRDAGLVAEAPGRPAGRRESAPMVRAGDGHQVVASGERRRGRPAHGGAAARRSRRHRPLLERPGAARPRRRAARRPRSGPDASRRRLSARLVRGSLARWPGRSSTRGRAKGSTSDDSIERSLSRRRRSRRVLRALAQATGSSR